MANVCVCALVKSVDVATEGVAMSEGAETRTTGIVDDTEYASTATVAKPEKDAAELAVSGHGEVCTQKTRAD